MASWGTVPGTRQCCSLLGKPSPPSSVCDQVDVWIRRACWVHRHSDFQGNPTHRSPGRPGSRPESGDPVRSARKLQRCDRSWQIYRGHMYIVEYGIIGFGLGVAVFCFTWLCWGWSLGVWTVLLGATYLHVKSFSPRQSSKHSRLDATDTVRLTSVLSL